MKLIPLVIIALLSSTTAVTAGSAEITGVIDRGTMIPLFAALIGLAATVGVVWKIAAWTQSNRDLQRRVKNIEHRLDHPRVPPPRGKP